MLTRLAVLTLTLLASTGIGRGQELTPGEIKAARMTRPVARLEATQTTCDFCISCASGEAQAFFNQGIAQLHALDAKAADHAFYRVTELAPDCAMAWWGLAVANVERRVLARHYLDRALQYNSTLPEGEKAWIMAWYHYLQEGAEDADRRRQLVQALSHMLTKEPSNTEAAAFLARQVIENRSAGIPVPFLAAVDALLERALKGSPEHPMTLYRLLLWEKEQPAWVAETAREVRRAMAHSPRALTAVGRLHARLGETAEASECFGSAHALIRECAADSRANALDFPGYVENAEHLLVALRKQGRLIEALELARHLIELPAVIQAVETPLEAVAETHPASAAVRVPFASENTKSVLTGQRHWIEILLEQKRWNDVTTALRSPYFAVTSPEAAGLRAHALGLAAIAQGDEEAVMPLQDELDQLAAQMPAGGWHLADEAFRARQSRFKEMAGDLRACLERAEGAKGFPQAVPAPRLQAASKAVGIPVHWTPPSAPAFSLPDKSSGLITLRRHAGRPLVLVFYRGAGCPHCIEQLRVLAPLHAEFSQAGIAVLAVSTDSVAGLKETLSAVGAETAVPFPLVSDEPLAAFRAYGAVDPRTGEAWHGVFLIDEQGRILWRDVGAEPFMALPELLAEAKRTLPLHASHPHAADGKTAATP